MDDASRAAPAPVSFDGALRCESALPAADFDLVEVDSSRITADDFDAAFLPVSFATVASLVGVTPRRATAVPGADLARLAIVSRTDHVAAARRWAWAVTWEVNDAERRPMANGEVKGGATARANGGIALVTGASKGIGFEVCRQLAASGFTVVLTARARERAVEAANALVAQGLDVRPLAHDVSSTGDAAALAQRVEALAGGLDVLVNNAASYADWQETPSLADLKKARDVMDTNLFGPWRTTQSLLPLLKRSRRARIVNVASGAGSHGDLVFGLAKGPASVSYAISKSALLALTTKLALELKGDRILVNAVCPGFTATAPGMDLMGARPIPEGARGILWAALLPDDGPTGGFFRDGQPLPW